jgi:hypothetical protein
MTPVTQWLHTQHEAFQPHMAHLRRLAAPQENYSGVAWRAALDDSCAFLQQELLPYLHVVEQVLYPLLAYLLEDPQPLAALHSAHHELRLLIKHWVTLGAALTRKPVDPARVSALAALGVLLESRVTTYFRAEAQCLAHLDTKVTPAAAQGLASALEMVHTLGKVEGQSSSTTVGPSMPLPRGDGPDGCVGAGA